MKRSRPQPPSTPELTRVVHQNIAALVEFRRQSERNQTIGERVAQQIVRFLGSFWSVLVHTAVVTIWIVTGPHGFFWPVLLMVSWGIGLVMNAWDVYVSSDITEQDIDREISRMHRR